MAEDTISPDGGRRHPLAGRKQTPEHIANRVAAVAKTRAAWTPEQYAKWHAANSAANRANGKRPEVRAANAEKSRGRPGPNKGKCWRDNLTADEVRARFAKWARERRRKSPKRALHERITARVRQCLRGCKYRRKWEDLVGYTLADLRAHLDKTMPPGCTWADFMSGALHIDHIIPVSAHNFSTPEDIDFRKCWALSNLRLLPASENLEKRAKLDRPFQPSLMLAAP